MAYNMLGNDNTDETCGTAPCSPVMLEFGDLTHCRNNEPVHFTEPHLLCTLPAGAQIIAIGPQIIVVAPNTAPCYLTPTGLKPIAVAPIGDV